MNTRTCANPCVHTPAHCPESLHTWGTTQGVQRHREAPPWHAGKGNWATIRALQLGLSLVLQAPEPPPPRCPAPRWLWSRSGGSGLSLPVWEVAHWLPELGNWLPKVTGCSELGWKQSKLL